MNQPCAIHLETENLTLIAQGREQVQDQIARMAPDERAQVSPAWLALLEGSREADPWIHGFLMTRRSDGAVIGQCGFKGPPNAEGVVEIAYGVERAHQGHGFATEAARVLTEWAFRNDGVRTVLAHTLPGRNASARVLTKCGFRWLGEVVDPEDGVVWRWAKAPGSDVD